MECTTPACTLNPLAQTILFQHKRAAHRVFSDVVGLNNIDHIALTTISPKNELTFLSYSPSMEHNLITTNLWAYDKSYDPDFFKKRQCKLWSDLYHKHKHTELMQVKQYTTGFTAGLSTSLSYQHCTLLLSFATKSKHMEADQQLLQAHPELLQMGRYCFQNISHLFMPYLGKTTQTNSLRIISPYMRLIVNNNTTEREPS